MSKAIKIVAISDTHSLHDDLIVPNGDILIHCGDATNVGSVQDVIQFNSWLGTLPHKYKIFVAGNHDFLFQTQPGLAKVMMTNCIYLQDEQIEIEGLKIYGSPWTPFFNDWAFGLERGKEIKRVWDNIPKNLDILITHGPPYGYLDSLPSTGHIGCEELIKTIKRVKPKYHLFGHIHNGYGKAIVNKINLINCAICDESYSPVNKPMEFKYERR